MLSTTLSQQFRDKLKISFNGVWICIRLMLARHLLYENIIKLKSLFVCLNALISGTSGSNSENLFALDSPFIEKGYRL